MSTDYNSIQNMLYYIQRIFHKAFKYVFSMQFRFAITIIENELFAHVNLCGNVGEGIFFMIGIHFVF